MERKYFNDTQHILFIHSLWNAINGCNTVLIVDLFIYLFILLCIIGKEGEEIF